MGLFINWKKIFEHGSASKYIHGQSVNITFHEIEVYRSLKVLDGGIGVWSKGGSKSELVSVFTYYCHVGYLADGGSVIRSLNSNNSYCEKGSIASGVDG